MKTLGVSLSVLKVMRLTLRQLLKFKVCRFYIDLRYIDVQFKMYRLYVLVKARCDLFLAAIKLV